MAYERIRNWLLIGAGVSMFYTFFSQPIFRGPEKPEIVKTHDAVEQTLSQLEWERSDLQSKFPYVNPEVSYFINTGRDTSKLVRAIESTKRDIAQIGQDSIYQDYVQRKQNSDKIATISFLGGFVGFLVCASLREYLRIKDLKKIRKKFPF